MEKRIKKLFNNLAEVRDYEVENCIKNKQSMTVIYAGKSMTLSPEQLVSQRKTESKAFNSNINNSSYKLYGYIWQPNE